MTRQTVRALCSFACLVLLLAAGCINYDQKMELNANGSGTMVMHYSMAQQLVSMMQMGGSAGAEGGGEQEMPFKLKEEEVKADLNAPGVKVEKFETKTEGDQQHFYVHLSFDNVASLNKTKTFKEMQVTWKEEKGVTTFSQVLKAKKKEGTATEGDDQMGKQMAQAMFGNAAFKYSVKFPSKVLPAPDTNGTISEDGQSVSWSFPLVEMDSGDKVMTAKFKSGGLPIKTLAIIAGAGFLTLIGLIGIILMMRKK
jgi:hypothetical protein